MISSLCALGTTPAESKKNLVNWLKFIVFGEGGPQALVTYQDGVEQAGLFHKLQQARHSHIEGKIIAVPYAFILDCRQHGFSAGTYFAIEGSGEGQCNIVHKDLGIFYKKP